MQFSYASPVRGFVLVTDWPVRALSQAKAPRKFANQLLGPSGSNDVYVRNAHESKDGAQIRCDEIQGLHSAPFFVHSAARNQQRRFLPGQQPVPANAVDT